MLRPKRFPIRDSAYWRALSRLIAARFVRVGRPEDPTLEQGLAMLELLKRERRSANCQAHRPSIRQHLLLPDLVLGCLVG